jgi:hypothetical protein
MATPSTSSDASSSNTAPKKFNLRNPLPLSAPQEQEVKALYYKRVRGHCAPEIKGMWHHFSCFQLQFPRPLFGINSTKPELGRVVPRAFLPFSQATV